LSYFLALFGLYYVPLLAGFVVEEPFVEFLSGDLFVGLVFACVVWFVVPSVEELMVFWAEGFEVYLFSSDHVQSWGWLRLIRVFRGWV